MLCFVVTAGAAFGFSSLQQKQYSASAELPFLENEAFRTLRASLRYFNVEAERLREQLGRLEAPVLGIVANAVKLKRRGRYGYGYCGGYYGPAAEQPAERAGGAGSGSGSGETA